MSEQAQAQPKRPPTDAASVIGTELPKWWGDPNTEDFRNTATTFAELLNPLPTSPEEAALMAAIPMAGGLISRVGLRKVLPLIKRFEGDWTKILDAVEDAATYTRRKGHEVSMIVSPDKDDAAKLAMQVHTDRSKRFVTPDYSRVPKSREIDPSGWTMDRMVARNTPVFDFHTHPKGYQPIFSDGDLYTTKKLAEMNYSTSQKAYLPWYRDKGFMIASPRGAGQGSNYTYYTILEPQKSSQVIPGIKDITHLSDESVDQRYAEIFDELLFNAQKGRAQLQYDLPEEFLELVGGAAKRPWSK